MRINHSEPAYSPDAAPYIKRLGGKLGGLAYLQQRIGNKVEALGVKFVPTRYEFADGSTDGELGEIPNHGMCIVRGSHKNDFQGLVDVLPTLVVPEDECARAINRIRSLVRTREIIDFAQYEDPTFSLDDLVIGIQPFQGDPSEYGVTIRGSFVSHPNQPNMFISSFYKFQCGTHEDTCAELIDSDGTMHGRYNTFNSSIAKDRYRRTLASLGSLVENSGLFKPNMSFQVEFSIVGETVYIHQTRAFLPKQCVTWRLGLPQEDEYRCLSFGVTQEEGIEFPIHTFYNEFCETAEPVEPYALIKNQHHTTPPLTYMPRRLGAYLGNNLKGSPTLDHNHYRLVQKANISVFADADPEIGYFMLLHARNKSTRSRVRIRTDGYQTAIEYAD